MDTHVVNTETPSRDECLHTYARKEALKHITCSDTLTNTHRFTCICFVGSLFFANLGALGGLWIAHSRHHSAASTQQSADVNVSAIKIDIAKVPAQAATATLLPGKDAASDKAPEVSHYLLRRWSFVENMAVPGYSSC